MKNKIVLISAAFVLVTAALMFTGCGDPGGGGGTNAATPTITVQPQDQEYIIPRDTVIIPLTVEATVTDGGKLTYQWYYAETLTGAGKKLDHETNSSYEPYEFDPTFEEDEGEYYYYVVVTNTNSKATGKKTASKTSERATVSLTVSDSWDAATPAITGQPQSATYTAGSAAEITPLTVTASKSSTSGTLSYQWYFNDMASIDGATEVGTNSASYTPDIDLESQESFGTYYYYVVVTNTDNSATGEKVKTATSTIATITVQAGSQWPAATPVIDVPPSFGEKTETFEGDTALTLTVTASASGEPTPGTLSYQWYKADSIDADGDPVGTNSNSYALTSSDLSTFGDVWFYVVVTNTNNNALGEEKIKTATSHRAKITIIDAALPVIANPALGGNKNFNIGADEDAAPVLDGTATVPNGDTPTYAWYSNATNSTTGGTAIPTATTAIFKPVDLTVESGLYYYVVVSNGAKSATSNAVQYSVRDPSTPYIITGSGSSFSATRGGTTVGTTGAIGAVIEAIRNNAGGADCIVQFGANGATNPLDIGSSTVSFANPTGEGSYPWGKITITGKITANKTGEAGTVMIGVTSTPANISAIINADITNSNASSSTAVESTGRAFTIHTTSTATVEITGGNITAGQGATGDGSGNAVYILGESTVIISGGTITSSNIIGGGNSGGVSGTVNLAGTGTLTITGTALITNARDAAATRVVTVETTGKLTISGTAELRASGTAGRVVYVPGDGVIHMGGTPKLTSGTNQLYRTGWTTANVTTAIQIESDFAPGSNTYTLASGGGGSGPANTVDLVVGVNNFSVASFATNFKYGNDNLVANGTTSLRRP